MWTPVCEQMHAVLRLEECECQMLGVGIHVCISVRQNYATSIDFTLFGKPYTLNVTAWQSRGLAKFLGLFHSHSQRDVSTYGEILVSPDGVTDFRMNVMQKGNAVIQASKDIMTCLSKITHQYRRSVLDYAVWYRERHAEEDTYSEYIARRTSHCIVHADFMAPDVAWNVVLFT